MKRLALYALCVFALGWAACAPAPMTTTGYSKVCSVQADCAAVFVGPVCGCNCTADAIAKTEIDRYQKEYSDRQKGCDNLPACAACPTVKVECNAGVCTALNPK